MRNRIRRPSFNNSRRNVTTYVFNFAVAAIMIAVGFLLSLPFLYVSFVLNWHFHSITFWPFIMLIAFMCGAPCFIGGLIGLLTARRSSPAQSNVPQDVERIRFAVETEQMKTNIK